MKKNEFISLIFPLKDRLFRIAWHIVRSREEAEDIVQDVMLKVWKMETPDMSSIEAYCYAMVRNLALNRLELKANRNTELEAGYDRDLHAGPYECLVDAEKLQLLHQVIANLPGLQRDIVQLRDVEGLSYLEIAHTLQLTEEQVKINLFRARKKVREYYLKTENYGL